MRNYSHIDKYLSEIYSDIYEQPEDVGHTEGAMRLCLWANAHATLLSVLDVGCGNGFCQNFIYNYTGIGMGTDIKDGHNAGRNVREMDFNFLEFSDNSFDTVLSRHSLEHSPFPVLTLMEWHRVARTYLVLCLPNPEHYTFTGRNHYSVATAHQAAWWLRRAGWRIRQARKTSQEFWFLCTKEPRIGHEGWARYPLHSKIYHFERDLFKNSRVEYGRVLDGIL